MGRGSGCHLGNVDGFRLMTAKIFVLLPYFTADEIIVFCYYDTSYFY